MKTFFFSRRRRQGSVIVIVTLSFTVLLGCAAVSIDYGMLTMDANRLQRGCDAAALAAARQLKKSLDPVTDRYNATMEAQRVAWQNDHVAVQASDVSFSNNDSTVQVNSTTTHPFFFAPAIGIKNGKVMRSAVASILPVSSISSTAGPFHVVPIGITWDTYNAYKNDQTTNHDLSLIRQNKATFGQDDMVLFDLRPGSSKSPAQMENQLVGTESETVNLGDQETTLNASSQGQLNHLTSGLDTLFSQAAGAPWYDNQNANNVLNGTTPPSDPRVVYLIITPSTSAPTNGTFNTPVQGFAPVYINSYSTPNGKGGNGNTNTGAVTMSVRFLPTSIASGSGLPTSSDPTTSYSGVTSVNLVG